MLVQHHHQPGVFDADHCRACARQAAGLLDHYRRVQQEEATLREAHARALEACRRAIVALWSAGAAILLAVVALLRG
jgi:predicted anti-sigma-YlaC factor YlaD